MRAARSTRANLANPLIATTSPDDDGVGDDVDEGLQAGVGAALVDLESLGKFGDEFSAIHCVLLVIVGVAKGRA